MKSLNLYLSGVGGQGIALLNEILIRASLSAGYDVKGVETHGIAQRGGVMVCHLRIGEKVFTPLIPDGEADMVISMERLEGLRGGLSMLKEGGTLIYYDTVQQPLPVRRREASYPEREEVEARLTERASQILRVEVPDIPDPRMLNVALVARLATSGVIEGLDVANLRETLTSVLPEHVLEKNLILFDRVAAEA